VGFPSFGVKRSREEVGRGGTTNARLQVDAIRIVRETGELIAEVTVLVRELLSLPSRRCISLVALRSGS
jgi:hypothetical protein